MAGDGFEDGQRGVRVVVEHSISLVEGTDFMPMPVSPAGSGQYDDKQEW